MSEKKAAGQFKEPGFGLCGVSFDEGVSAGSRKRRLHCVPLVVLLAGVYATTGVGTRYRVIHPTPQMPVPVAQASSLACITPQSLPGVCTPTPRADVGLWTLGTAGTADYLLTDVAQAPLEQSTTGVTTHIWGRGGYLFLPDVFNANSSRVLGHVHLTPEQMSAWNRYMGGIETAMSEQDVTAFFMPAPITWDIYSGKLPQWTDPLMGMTPLDLTRSALLIRAWVDVREGLCEAREGGGAPLCSAANPRWLSYAVHIMWNQMLSCLAVVSPQFEGLSSLASSSVSSVNAPNGYEALGVPIQNGPQMIPTYEQDPGGIHLLQPETRDDLADTAARLVEVTGASEVSLTSPVDFQNRSALTYNPNGRGTALIVRDSQGNNLGSEVAATFEYTTQVSHGLDTEWPTDVAALTGAYKLSVVIVEFTLCYPIFMPAAGK